MASSPENISMAVFCDFENVALGVRDANYEKFDIKPVLERLLLKGSIVVKKAYCDWERYKGFKATMHEANFELIEIPHVRQSGKNSADIRLVVDALDLCYTKSHVNTFVIISGDSDFSPLVSKLRENNKQVIGVGVKQSTSDLLVANCDEFIFYDDLVREVKRAAAKRDERKAQPQQKRAAASTDEGGNKRKEELESRKSQAIEMVVEMFDALVSERGDSGKIWASLLKDTLKRRRPDFNETYFGFRTFGNLLEEAQARGMLEFGRDEKSGAYVYRSSAAAPSVPAEPVAVGEEPVATAEVANEEVAAKPEPRRGRGRGRSDFRAPAEPAVEAPVEEVQEPEAASEPVEQVAPQPEPRRGRGRGRTDFRAPVVSEPESQPEMPAEAAEAPAAEAQEWNEDSPFPPPAAEKRRGARSPRKGSAKQAGSLEAVEVNGNTVAAEPVDVDGNAAPAEKPRKTAARKAPARPRRPAKPKAAEQG